MAEAALGPSTSGSVVLDLGPGTGALVLHAPPELDGEEIEISRTADPPGVRTHSRVRRRDLPDRTQYAAVYPGLAAGSYAIWLDPVTPVGGLNVREGQVTTAPWPG